MTEGNGYDLLVPIGTKWLPCQKLIMLMTAECRWLNCNVFRKSIDHSDCSRLSIW